MTRKGRAGLALGSGLVFSVIGGLFGTAFLVVAAPSLAEVALKFVTFEYFWLVLLGLACAVFIAVGDALKCVVSLLIGLLVSAVGLDNPSAHPRFTFGNSELAGGLQRDPIMSGMFAVFQLMRSASTIREPWEMAKAEVGNVFKGMGRLIVKYPLAIVRGSALGTAIGALPGAGADIAAWMSYAMSKKFSKEPEKFGTGHVEGIVESGAANNSALAGAWIPALVFGIPGDSITAIVIGVLYIKGLNPGPTTFIDNAPSIYAIFIVFVLANLLMLPLGVAAIRASKQMLRAPREVLLPVILLFCIVGSFAINNSIFGVVLMLAFGVVGYVMEENGFPIAPAILGMVLGAMLEENFISSMIKADGRLFAFFERPIAGALGVLTIAVFAVPLVRRALAASTARP